MENNLQIRTGKTWHGNDQIVIFQCKFIGIRDTSLPKKFFLICDSNQASRGFRLSLQKPGNLKNPGMAANMLRKFMPSSVLKKIIKCQDFGDYWGVFSTHRELSLHAHIAIRRSSPPELIYIDHDDKVLFQIGKRGSFTKQFPYQKKFPNGIPDIDDTEDILPKLISDLLNTNAHVQDPEDTQNELGCQPFEDGSDTNPSPEETHPIEPTQREADAKNADPNPTIRSRQLPSDSTTGTPPDPTPQIPKRDTDEASENSAEKSFSPLQREAKNRLKRKIKTVQKAISKMQEKIPTEADLARFRLNSQMIRQYSYLIKPDMVSLKIDSALHNGAIDQSHNSSINTNGDLEIPIPEHTSIGKLVSDTFLKLKKMQKSRLLGVERLRQDTLNLVSMLQSLDSLQAKALSTEEISEILRSFKIPVKKPDLPRSRREHVVNIPYRTYRALDGSVILVGKSSADNDILAKKARSNDFWLHAIGVTGSHVIVPIKSLKNKTLSPNVERQAAILALHFSKIRTDHAGELYFTRKQHIKKKKGMPPGLWSVEKSETIFIKYTENELKEILERLEI